MANAKIIEMKAQQVADIKEKIAKSQSMVVFDYRGLTVEEVRCVPRCAKPALNMWF